jgi:hypothetical protein
MKANLDHFLYQQKEQQNILEKTKELVEFFPLNSSKFRDENFAAAFFKYFPLTFHYYSFDPREGTINSILNTSALEIIRNEELRLLIASWSDLVEDYKEEEITIHNWVEYHYMPFLNKYLVNPQYVPMDFEKVPYYEFQGLIANRLNLQELLIEQGEGNEVLETMNRIIELTEQKK